MKKKRQWTIWRLQSYHNPEYAHEIPKAAHSTEAIYNLLVENGAPKDCYFLMPDHKKCGEVIPLREAIGELMFLGPGLISCIHGKLAYLETELQPRGMGVAGRYLLIRDLHVNIK